MTSSYFSRTGKRVPLRPRAGLRRLAYAAAATAGLTALAACSSGSASSSSAPSGGAQSTAAVQSSAATGTTLNVSVYNNMPPDAATSNGALVGWVPDMLVALQKQSGLNFHIVAVDQFSGLIPGLQSGRYDMSPSLFYITAQRLKAVDMVTISQVGTGFGDSSTNPVTVKTATDICGHKVAALAGSAYPAQVAVLNKQCTAAGKPPATVQVYPDDSSAILSVTNHRNDLYAVTTDQLSYLQQQGVLQAQPFVYDNQPEAIAFPKGSKYEAPIVAAIDALIKSGTYGSILSKWHLGSMAITQSVINPPASS
jgi:polar amino acid transport system substrate-binding protein